MFIHTPDYTYKCPGKTSFSLSDADLNSMSLLIHYVLSHFKTYETCAQTRNKREEERAREREVPSNSINAHNCH